MNNTSNNFWHIGFVTSIVFWLAIILAFLYLPYVYDYFATPKTINVYTWADMFDEESLQEFEKETGIRVNLSYYDNNEELLTKLRITKGRGYDLIVITDYGVPDLSKLKIAKRIDKQKLNFWHELEPKVLGNYYDPENEYTIPIAWDVYGLGVNVETFKGLPKPSWDLIFDTKNALSGVGMVDDGFESVMIAAQYLYGNVDTLSKEQLEEIKQLLIAQKKLVEAYTDLRGDYLLMSGASPSVVTQSAYIYRAINNDDRIKFLFPKEGSFKIVDNLVIPQASSKDDMIYRFVNFIEQKHVAQRLADEFASLPVRKDVLHEVDLDYLGGVDKLMDPELFDKLDFFRRVASMRDVGKLWIEVKAS